MFNSNNLIVLVYIMVFDMGYLVSQLDLIVSFVLHYMHKLTFWLEDSINEGNRFYHSR